MREILLLDLDDTLYDERSYVLSGFRAVAAQLGSVERVDPALCFQAMLAELEANGRGHVFDRLLETRGIVATPERIAGLVALYRNHAPKITLYPGVADVLDRLSARVDIALVTDGLGSMQRRKVEALGVDRWVRTIVYCWELNAPKPAAEGYLEALRRLGIDARQAPERCIVIGDNPAHDMAAADALGIRSIRVRTGRFAPMPTQPLQIPALEIPRFTEVEAALAKILPRGGINSDVAATPQ
ncbi:MAG TPA: HAD family hydrolase [Aliidongia sp.]|nr:HAD family hydrolase [Aliidongia sp.]